jgi:hypothetical protein
VVVPRPKPTRGVACVLLLLALGAPARAQIYVYPRRPTQTDVRYSLFEWKYLDLLVGQGKVETTWEQGPRLHLRAFEAPPPGSAWNWKILTHRPGEATGADDTLRQVPSGGTAPGPGTVNPPTPEAGPEPIPSTPEPSGPPPPQTQPATQPAVPPKHEGGGVRLFFYERERPVAHRAAGFVEQSYHYLAKSFDFVPRETFPYFLYSSYLEFLQTNLFPIEEGVLGVTSPESLEVTLPYFGDHRRFVEISTHELSHEFTIQKTLAMAKDHDIPGNPVWRMPLWFVEGLAEFYAHHGIDPETDMLVRDILVNPVVERGHVYHGFFEDRPYSVLWTYKLGQARCAFLEETYGTGVIQKILTQSPRLLAKLDGQPKLEDFPALVAAVTGDEPRTISAKFEDWVKRRSFRAFVAAKQDLADLAPLPDARDEVQSLATSPEGHLLLYRTIEPETGQRRLYLVDDRVPRDDQLVAMDGVPGVESLHPVSGRSFTLHENELAYVALDGDSDVIYWQRFSRTVEKDGDKLTAVDFRLGDRRRYDFGDRGLIAIDSPTFSPDGRRLTFIGLDNDGVRDVYLFTPHDGDAGFDLARLTNDPYGERQVTWGPGGIVYTSDATEHSHYNLFRLDPDHPEHPTRLTWEAEDEIDPVVLSDGRVFFSEYDQGGANLYQWTAQGVQRRTDVPTGLFDPGAGPGGGLWALFYRGGSRVPVRVAADKLLAGPTDTTPAATGAPYALPDVPLEGARPYEPYDIHNWQSGNIFALFGASAGGIFGQLIATANDRLRNHALILNVFAFGSLSRTDADLFYINQEHRTIWGLGAFHDLRFHVDRTFEGQDVDRFITDERFYGAEGTVRYPFSRFTFFQGSLALGGVDYALEDSEKDFLRDPVENGTGRNLVPEWEQENRGTRMQGEVSGSFGYNTLRYHYLAGPIAGSSALFEASLGTQPLEPLAYETLRFDGEHYFRLFGRTHIFFRGGSGATFGSQFGREFFLYSFDTLRGVPFGDDTFLLGRKYFFATGQLEFPLNELVRIPVIDLEGVLGCDFGGVGLTYPDLWDRRVLDLALGVNFGIGPLVLRLHYAKPFDIGAFAVPNDGNWVTNLSLAWRY